MDDNREALRKRPAAAFIRRRSRLVPSRAERPRPASHDPGMDCFNWAAGERVDGPRRVTRKHFVGDLNER
jgi:hypothetical protein